MSKANAWRRVNGRRAREAGVRRCINEPVNRRYVDGCRAPVGAAWMAGSSPAMTRVGRLTNTAEAQPTQRAHFCVAGNAATKNSSRRHGRACPGHPRGRRKAPQAPTGLRPATSAMGCLRSSQQASAAGKRGWLRGMADDPRGSTAPSCGTAAPRRVRRVWSSSRPRCHAWRWNRGRSCGSPRPAYAHRPRAGREDRRRERR